MRFCGREWEDCELLKKFRSNSGLILDYKLALENYVDLSGNDVPEFFKLDHYWHVVKKDCQNLSDKEYYDISCDVLNQFKQIVEIIGKEHFIFYDDGGIDYKSK